jgi:tetratricopeptide (TPR) repeat protein
LYERLDREALAKHWYVKTLEQTPNLAHAAFWRSNPLRVAVAEPYVRSDHSARSQEDSNLAQECLAAGREALSVDRYEVALTAFECALESQPNSIKARRGRAEAYAALGRYAEAERELHKAQLSGGSPLDELHTAGALAQIQYDRGDITEGINILESAIDRAQRSVMHGKVVRWSRCGWLLFARRDLGAHLLPQLTTITVTDEMVDWILLLGRYYEEVGDVPAATRVYSQLLDAVPGCDAARRRLISIGEVDSD